MSAKIVLAGTAAVALGGYLVIRYLPAQHKVWNLFSSRKPLPTDDEKAKATKLIPLVGRLSKDFPVAWSVLTTGKGIFTVEGSQDQVDLVGKKIQLQKVDIESLQKACQHIEGEITCSYKVSETDPFTNYYRESASQPFVEIPAVPPTDDEDAKKYAPLEAKFNEIQKRATHTHFDVSALPLQETKN